MVLRVNILMFEARFNEIKSLNKMMNNAVCSCHKFPRKTDLWHKGHGYRKCTLLSYFTGDFE